MKKLLLSLALGAAAILPAMADAPLWLREPAISPDGANVAFTYKGDIYIVPTAGGKARQLTTNAAYDATPVWTPDGKRIAFRSDREGSFDLYIVGVGGGTPTRLTTSSSNETPLTFLDNSTLLFSGSEMPGRFTARAPFSTMTMQLNVDKPGQRPTMFLSVPMLSANANAAGQLLYTDRKGVENVFRKHERSSATRDIWLYSKGDFKQLTTFNGHDTDPIWDGANAMYYLSEEDGTINVYSANLDGTAKKQLTKFTKHPVRTLSAAANGTLAFSWDGEIYSLAKGGQPKKINVEITADQYDSDHVKNYIRNGATTYAVSPSGDEIAFVVRGDVYVTNTNYATTRRITNTPAQERGVSFSPDGRTLVYDSDRGGYWQLYTASIKNPDEKQFAYATEIVEEPLYKCATSAQWPQFSPDGKKVAFLEDRTILRVIDVKSKKVNTALDGKYNYSYTDGDIGFEWSPDSRWLLTTTIGQGGWHNTDIALASADGQTYVDLTETGYADSNPKWIMGGKGIAYVSGRDGTKAHGSWGNTSDVYVMFLDGDAWEDFNLSEEEAAIKEKALKEAKDKEAKEKAGEKKGDKKGGEKKADAAKDDVAPLEFDLQNRRYRTARITPSSSYLQDFYVSPKGDKLYYTTQATEGGSNLLVRDLKKGDTRVLTKGVGGGMDVDKKGNDLYMRDRNGFRKISLPRGEAKPIQFEAIYDRHPSLEREYMYDHMLRQVNDKFYDKNLHGVDWDYYGKHYRRFLPYINNNRDFADLLSEILGELNASHTGGGARVGGTNMPTAFLGAYIDENYDGEGIRIAEVLPGGPLTIKSSEVLPGEIILAIDGEKIAPRADFNPMLEGKAGKKVILTVKGTDGKQRTVFMRPASAGAQQNLAYRRWIERNEHIVDSVSGGRIGYVHVQGMNGESFRTAYDRILGKYRNCDAVVVDTRYNGGGWLHNDLALLLGGKEYVRYSPRGRYIGSEPFSQWSKPSVMLVNEANYSDAHGSPYTYQTLGIGDVVGAPIPGTMTAVWWETQIDPTIYFGIPQVTSLDRNGKPLENQQLNPDVLIINQPGDLMRGVDAQLEGAVKHLMNKTAKNRK